MSEGVFSYEYLEKLDIFIVYDLVDELMEIKKEINEKVKEDSNKSG